MRYAVARNNYKMLSPNICFQNPDRNYESIMTCRKTDWLYISIEYPTFAIWFTHGCNHHFPFSLCRVQFQAISVVANISVLKKENQESKRMSSGEMEHTNAAVMLAQMVRHCCRRIWKYCKADKKKKNQIRSSCYICLYNTPKGHGHPFFPSSLLSGLSYFRLYSLPTSPPSHIPKVFPQNNKIFTID